MRFFIADGKIVEKKNALLLDDYIIPGLRLTQNIWYGYGGIPLFSDNLNLLKKRADLLKISFPPEFNNTRELFRLVKRMLNKNKLYRSGYVHLQIIKNAGSIHTVATCSAVNGFTLPFSEEGLLMSFSGQKKYTSNPETHFDLVNEPLWESALAELKDSRFNQTIILNDRNYVCECPYGNLYMRATNTLITPSRMSGCHENALRSLVFEAACIMGLKIVEEPELTKEMLLEADELFSASEEYGFHWVLGINDQRFVHYYSRIINEQVNILLRQKAAVNTLS